MSKETLKNKIDLDINTNGLQQITGEKLNNVLNDIVDEMALDGGVVEEGNPNAVSGGEVFEVVNGMGYTKIPANTNFISELTNSDKNNPELWELGIYDNQGRKSLYNIRGAVRSVKLYKLAPNSEFTAVLNIRDNSTLALYDENGIFSKAIEAGHSTNLFKSYTFNTDSTSFYAGVTFENYLDVSGISIKNTNDIFLRDENISCNVNEVLKDEYDINYTPVNTNFISELTNSDKNNPELWEVGGLDANGSEIVVSNRLRSVKYYPIKRGFYELSAFFSATHVIIYDKDKNVANVMSDGGFTNYVDVEEDGYIRVSINNVFETSKLYFINKYPIGEPVAKLKDISAEIESYGVESIEAGTNFIEELTGSILDDTSLWRIGFITENGTVNNNTTYRTSVKIYMLRAGVYDLNLNFGSSSRCELTNLDGSLYRLIVPGEKVLDIDEDKFIRISTAVSLGTDNLSIKNRNAIKPKIVTNFNINQELKNNSYLSILRNKALPKKRMPMVTFIADDGATKADDWFIPILDAHNVKASFAIIGSRTVNADNGAGGSYNSQQVKELHEKGHAILSHSWNHNRFNNVTREVFEYELSRTKVFLESIINDKVNLYVSPFGESGGNNRDLRSNYYDGDFITWTNNDNPLPLNEFSIKRISFDCPETDFQLLWDTILKPAIDRCITNQEWLVFAVHPQYTQYFESNPDYLQRREELEQVIDYCIANDVLIVNANVGFNYWRNLYNVGTFNSNPNSYFSIGMDGSEIGNYFD